MKMDNNFDKNLLNCTRQIRQQYIILLITINI